MNAPGEFKLTAVKNARPLKAAVLKNAPGSGLSLCTLRKQPQETRPANGWDRMVRWQIESIEALSGLRLRVRFADGVEGVVELRAEELTGVLQPLREPSYFEQVRLVDEVPTWPNGEELAPDGLRGDLSID